MTPRRPLPWLALLLAASPLAGCLGNDAAPRAPQEQAQAPAFEYYTVDEFPVEIDHDHSDPALHAESLNVEFVAFHSCTPQGDVASAVGGYTDIAFHGSLAFVGTGNGFCILNVEDPAHPKFISNYEGEFASDLEVSADGNLVFLLTQRNGAPRAPQRGVTDPFAVLPRGVILVNVQDKSAPVFESYYPVPTNGVHTATSYRMGDRQLLFIQTYDWVPPGGVPSPTPQQNAPVTQRVEITEVTMVGGVRMLNRLAMWSLDRPLTSPFIDRFPHDSAVQFHAVLNRTLLYIAYWDAGLVILDVEDPTKPTLVAQYEQVSPSIYNQYHDVKVFDELIDGRHITVTGPEIPAGPEAGMVRVFDTTDPRKPAQIGTWRLPGNPGTPGGFVFSPHVFTLDHGLVYIGHNHGGVWVIDVHNETLLQAPGSAGYFFPRGDEAKGAWSPSASVWGAYYHEGHVYATEGSSGVHVLRFAGDTKT